IYTRTGDQGMTGLATGDRVAKNHLRIEAGGTIDELNSQIGVLLTTQLPTEIAQELRQIQNQLFNIGAQISQPDYQTVQLIDVEKLEQELDLLNQELPTLKEFILPGGNQAGALCHLARAVCRRAERQLYSLFIENSDLKYPLIYLNRLSDYLFVCARTLNHLNGNQEIYWSKHLPPNTPN
ncbi:MAG TPA: cob(I)yrinic acid a,c-diamide adenosyltransferase, partial [Gammaproteobacteria bacterium]|nr:cob(I)yrinic acid a,c-diamide adenosyltransferase [Gammaproteobacteria bacterium]